MNAHSPRAMVSRWIVVAVVAGLLQLGAAAVAAHTDHDCGDESCSTLLCDMAAAGGCASHCAHAAAVHATPKPLHSTAPSLAACGPDTGPGLRLPERLFRPPALA